MATPTDWAGRFILTSDIDLNGVFITPIAPDTSTSYGFQGTQFTGVFDGNYNVIRNADVNMPGIYYVGLFGYLGTDGQIRNLGVEDASIFGRRLVGGLVGYNYGTISNCYSTDSVNGYEEVGGLVGYNGGTISKCYSTGPVTGNELVGGLVGLNWFGTVANCYSTGSVNGDEDVGGLVGGNDCGSISNCYSTASVSGDGDVGGLVGWNRYGIISNCSSTGSVNGTGSYVGGLVGWNYSGTIRNCYSTNSVSGTDYVGGLVGENVDGAISNCYSTGSVSGMDDVGGLVGWDSGTISNSFWDVNTSGWPTSAGGEAKTTAEMKTKSTFTDAGWDFVEVWGIGEHQTYPYLSFAPAGDLNYDKKVDFLDLAILASHWLEDGK